MKTHPRLINQLFENLDFYVDDESVPYIVRDIINMNWWNTCGFVVGYRKNRRVFAHNMPSRRQKAIAIILKEFYRENQLLQRDPEIFETEIIAYICGGKKSVRQLKLFSMEARRNVSQYYRDAEGLPTWLDCTSRAKYAFSYVGANGYIDFDGVCRLDDAEKIMDLWRLGVIHDLSAGDKTLSCDSLFDTGANTVKSEIFSQRNCQNSVAEWVHKLGIIVIPERQNLFKKIGHVCTDPFKNFEKFTVDLGIASGVNEAFYGFLVGSASHASDASHASSASSASRASDASHASHASRASDASSASYASRASRASRASSASYASHASDASSASDASHASRASSASSASRASSASSASNAGVPPFRPKSGNWFNEPKAFGPIPGLQHPKEFRTNKYGLAGHWKINDELVRATKIGWFDPFMGHGESPLLAARYGIKYLGQDINSQAINGYLQRIAKHTFPRGARFRVWDSIKFDPDLVGGFDLCYTSPPYFDFEEYCEENLDQIRRLKNYADFHNKVTKPVFSHVRKYLVPGGILALQTEKDKRTKEAWKNTIIGLGYTLVADTLQGKNSEYSKFSKRDQTLLIFENKNI